MTASDPVPTLDLDALSARLDDLDDAMAPAVDRFLDLAQDELQPVLAELVGHDEERRVVAHQLGIRVRARPARELAAEVLRYAERDLQPHVRFATSESAEAAADALRKPTRDVE
jgi:hypothetical protein